jgi:hypothetical protein
MEWQREAEKTRGVGKDVAARADTVDLSGEKTVRRVGWQQRKQRQRRERGRSEVG